MKVYGALRATFKMLLMWNSQIQVDGGGTTLYTISVLEVRNLIVLRVWSFFCFFYNFENNQYVNIIKKTLLLKL